MTTTTLRRTAFVAGVLYLVTFITSIPALGLYDKVLNDPNFVLGGVGSVGGVQLGALLEVICGLAGIGTAVALYPVVKRKSAAAAVGFVGSRVFEAAMIFVGVVSLMSIVTLRQDVAGTAGADSASLVTTAHSLVALHDWTFLFGPGVMASVNALCLATVMYRSRLVPRVIPTVGLIGAPLLVASSCASLFGAWDQVSSMAMLCAFPIAAWEFSLGVWMTFKGFRPSPITADIGAPVETPALDGVAA